MSKINLITAGAGTGKTTRLTDIIHDAVAADACRPGGLIATTYTVKAAQEITDRIRTRLFEAGLHCAAQRLHESMIGTVHSVCGRLLERFAFEAGISPQLQILPEQDADLLFARALEEACSSEEIELVQDLADRFEDRNRDYSYRWRQTVADIAEQLRANDLRPEALHEMAEWSVTSFFEFLPEPDPRDLDALLERAMAGTICALETASDPTKKTADVLKELREAQFAIQQGALTWSKWAKLSKLAPAVASQACCEDVIEIASCFEAHPGLRKDIAQYTRLLFDLAARTLDGYARLKSDRGLLDFTDLEHEALQLLQKESVCQSLSRELDLLVVDEFQDTSPIQLALFLRLAECAAKTVWVGDVKQAIYGFRGTDPRLISAVAAALKTKGGPPVVLDTSYRSVPDLVRLANQIFAPAFARSLDLSSAEVCLKASRPAVGPTALHFFDVNSGATNKKTGGAKRMKNEDLSKAIAAGIHKLLQEDSDCRIADRRQGDELRPVQPGDMAVLCRSNENVAAIAQNLADLGYTVSVAGPGLFSTPECQLAMACLRRLADPTDSLATAIILAMRSELPAGDLIADRIEYIASVQGGERADRWGLEETLADPVILALEQMRSRLAFLSPSEALDQALIAGGVFPTVTSWGPAASRSEQRRANLEALRGYVRTYEETCRTTGTVATLTGFVFWHDQLAARKLDCQAADESADAIHVLTYHKAKGLEWPVTVCTDLDDEPKSRLWGLQVVQRDEAISFDFHAPLGNRALRYWIWPFGRQARGIALADRISNSPAGLQAKQQSEAEELRLLYVGLTRARDILILAGDQAREPDWLNLAGADWLRPGQDKIPLADGEPLASRTHALGPADQDFQRPVPQTDFAWFEAGQDRVERPPANVLPSSEPQISAASIGDLHDLNGRLPITGNPDEAILGDALHAVFAAELLNPGQQDRDAMTRRILKQHGLETHIQPSDLLNCVDRFRTRCQTLFAGASCRVEVPFSVWNSHKQNICGYIDLLLETPEGVIVIDHKSFPGRKADWHAKALSYSGQLACYRQALVAAGKTVLGTWIHFTVGGGLVEVRNAP